MTEPQRDKLREKNRKWFLENCERAKDRSRRWYFENAESVREKKRKYRAENPVVMRGKDRERKYGLALPEFLEIQQKQKGICAICKKAAASCVDHSHKTSKVRALLCRNCNSGLGLFKDDFSTLIRAADYIRQHEGIQ